MGNKKISIPFNRIMALVLLDIMAVIISSFGALYIRFDFSFSNVANTEYFVTFQHIFIPNVLIAVIFFWLWKLYKSVWRYASANELINIVFATSCIAVIQTVFCYATGLRMPKSYYVLYWFLLTIMVCATRFGYRILRVLNNKRTAIAGKNYRTNAMVIGAGAAGNMILKEIESSRYLNIQLKCIIDDQPGYHGKFLRGVPIVGQNTGRGQAIRR